MQTHQKMHIKITRIRTPESKSLKKEAPLCARAYTHLTLYTPQTERENAREKTAPLIVSPQNILSRTTSLHSEITLNLPPWAC